MSLSGSVAGKVPTVVPRRTVLGHGQRGGHVCVAKLGARLAGVSGSALASSVPPPPPLPLPSSPLPLSVAVAHCHRCPPSPSSLPPSPPTPPVSPTGGAVHHHPGIFAMDTIVVTELS